MTDAVPAARFSIEPYDRARHGDGPAEVVRDVYREYGFTWEPEGYHLDLLRPEDAYAPPDAFFDVAVMGGRVVGTVGGTATGDEAELKRLYLYRSARGRGVGRALAERFLAWARAKGCDRAVLWSDKRLTEAHHLYGKLGFVVTGSRICPGDPDRSDEWGLTLPLR